MNKITENLQTPVNYKCDTLVVGGGIAGIAAALAAAREGSSVILAERSYMLGGLATSGLVTIYLPLCDGRGEQVSFGIAEELLLLSVKHGAEGKYPLPDCWLKEGNPEERAKERYKVSFNPWLFAIDAEKLLRSSGVKILYGVTACSVDVNEGRIEHVVIESKSGREAIKIDRFVIDCSGDADVAYMSGAPCAEFAPKNKLAAWYYFDNGEGNHLSMLGVCDDMTVKHRDLTGKRYRALTAEELTDMMLDSHDSTYNDILRRRANGETVSPTSITHIPQVRMTRRIVGEYTMRDTEVRVRFDDSVGAFSDWRRPGPAYELPVRSLYSKSVKNLLTAGRCLSADDEMWDITRVIPVCAVSGEAAGVISALSESVDAIDVGRVQSVLESNGAKIHL